MDESPPQSSSAFGMALDISDGAAETIPLPLLLPPLRWTGRTIERITGHSHSTHLDITPNITNGPIHDAVSSPGKARAKNRCKRSEIKVLEKRLLRKAQIIPELSKAHNLAEQRPDFSFVKFSFRDTAVLQFPSESYDAPSFAGQITIQDRLSALQLALDEYWVSKSELSQMVYWVDGSVFADGDSGTAVVFKEDASSKWTIRGHNTKDRISPDDAEAFAFMHVLEIAIDTININVMISLIVRSWNVIVIYSDSQFALESIRDLGLRNGDRYVHRPVLRSIRAQVGCLELLSVQVQLRWVPAHRKILGNVLADNIAKITAKWKY